MEKLLLKLKLSLYLSSWFNLNLQKWNAPENFTIYSAMKLVSYVIISLTDTIAA
jgi:hypothetical protein